MEVLWLVGAGLLFFLHLFCENLASFVKYNFAGIGRHMQGVAISNYFGIASRGFVAAYGVLVSLLIEEDYGLGRYYTMVLSLILLIGAGSAVFLSKLSISNKPMDRKMLCFNQGGESLYIFFQSFGSRNVHNLNIKFVHSLFVGVQFAAIVIAYALCFHFPSNRLLIISFVPVISMLGTFVTVIFVEPRLAIIVDRANSLAHEVSQAFLTARAVSFMFSFFILLFTVLFEL